MPAVRSKRGAVQQATFDPQLIARYRRRFPGFDDEIVSMSARGMRTREIVGHLRELYGIEVLRDLISAVTDAVLEAVAVWQARPLEPAYRIVIFDAPRIKVRDEVSSATRPSTSRWACASTDPNRCSAFGWSRRKAPSSGCGS
jgi:hypothetical protein